MFAYPHQLTQGDGDATPTKPIQLRLASRNVPELL